MNKLLYGVAYYYEYLPYDRFSGRHQNDESRRYQRGSYRRINMEHFTKNRKVSFDFFHGDQGAGRHGRSRH